jgi:hypothetical protein
VGNLHSSVDDGRLSWLPASDTRYIYDGNRVIINATHKHCH